MNLQSNAKRIGFGVVGLGRISRPHIHGLLSAQDCARIVVVYDVDMELASVGVELGARVYQDYSDVLADPDVRSRACLTCQRRSNMIARAGSTSRSRLASLASRVRLPRRRRLPYQRRKDLYSIRVVELAYESSRQSGKRVVVN